MSEEDLDCIVIGAGWAGLGVAASLKASGVQNFKILERGDCVGYFWSKLYDSIHMNSWRHELWKNPPELDGNKFSQYKTKKEVLQYLNEYTDGYKLKDHLCFSQDVQTIEMDGDRWIVKTDRGEFRAKYLTVATSPNRLPHIPDLPGLDAFPGKSMHTFQYEHSKQEDWGDDIVVVGCGNSAMEIAGQIADAGNKVKLIARSGRHFCLEKTKHRLENLQDKLTSAELLIRDTCRFCFKDKEFHEEVNGKHPITDFLLFKDLKKYNFPTPELEALAVEQYEKKLIVVDRTAYKNIVAGNIEIVHAGLESVEGSDLLLSDGQKLPCSSLILGTGYRHGLEKFFGSLWPTISSTQFMISDKLARTLPTQSYPTPWPKTDGRGKSIVYPNLYFAGFDTGLLGGRSVGLWTWHMGEDIAYHLGKIRFNQRTVHFPRGTQYKGISNSEQTSKPPKLQGAISAFQSFLFSFSRNFRNELFFAGM